MINLLLSVCCSITIAVLMKTRKKFVANEMAMFMANYFICFVLSFYFTKQIHFIKDAHFSIILGFISGALYLSAFVISDKNLQANGMIMSNIFSKLGVLVPTILSLIVFGQKLKPVQSLGFVLAITGIILIYFEKNALTQVKVKKYLLFHLLCSGMVEVMTSLYDHYGAVAFKDQYLFFNFLFALFFTICVVIKKGQKIQFSELVWGALIGIPNYFSSRFLLYALESVPALIAFPIVSVGSITGITLIGFFLFKEKLSVRKVLALMIVAVAVILLNR